MGDQFISFFFSKANFLHITNVHIKTNGINEFFPFPMQIIKNNFKKISQEKISTDASYSFWAKQ